MADRVSRAEAKKMKAALGELRDSTRADYEKLARHFYEHRLNGEPITPKRIKDALRKAAADYRPDYWRRLRNALMYDQISIGYYGNAAAIKMITNPVTRPKTEVERKFREKVGNKPGQRQTRIKKMPAADMSALKRALAKKEDFEVIAAVLIAEATGARPAEMLGIECRPNGTIFIPGAKKGSDGQRGLDRELSVSAETWKNVREAVEVLRAADPKRSGAIHRVQSRLRTLTKRLWPRRSAHPTLYTFRYAMGSELKASGLSRREVAYIMGHQSEQSVDRYGDRRSGSGRTPITAAPDADMSGVRKGYREPFTPSEGVSEGPSPRMG